jgi:copper(I)-binding protein
VGPLEVAGAVIGEPAVPDRAALYLHLRNPGDATVRIVGVRVEDVAAVEFHETRMEDGLMAMQPLDGLSLAPGEAAVLRPGGLHIMLAGVTRPLTAGDTVPVTLVLEDGGEGSTFHARVVPLTTLDQALALEG